MSLGLLRLAPCSVVSAVILLLLAVLVIFVLLKLPGLFPLVLSCVE